MDDMLRSLARAKPSVAPEDLKELEEWTRKYGEEDGLPMYETTTTEPETPERTKEQIMAVGDPKMVALLQAAKIPDDNILKFILEHMDYDVLVHHASKDVRDTRGERKENEGKKEGWKKEAEEMMMERRCSQRRRGKQSARGDAINRMPETKGNALLEEEE